MCVEWCVCVCVCEIFANRQLIVVGSQVRVIVQITGSSLA